MNVAGWRLHGLSGKYHGFWSVTVRGLQITAQAGISRPRGRLTKSPFCCASSVPLSRRERQYNRTLFSQFPLFYRNAFLSPKGEGFTDPLSGTLNPAGDSSPRTPMPSR